jgi:hypothetical protein
LKGSKVSRKQLYFAGQEGTILQRPAPHPVSTLWKQAGCGVFIDDLSETLLSYSVTAGGFCRAIGISVSE